MALVRDAIESFPAAFADAQAMEIPCSAITAVEAIDIHRCSIYGGGMTKQRTMQEASFLILTALAGGSQHGYGIVTDVMQISDGRVQLKAGTLYAALDRLTAEGLIEPDREEIVDNRLRRYYGITSDGAQRLAEEAYRLRANAHAALARLRPGVAIS
jgi:PadR family transcriptional regulator, regulatory protein PadR